MNPNLVMVAAGELDLAVWEWPGQDPPLLFAHATGFHGRCWDQVVTHFPGRRCLAVDFRGHGRSSKPDPPYKWPAFGRDLAAIAEQLGVRDAIGIGHSMGGHSVVASAAFRPETFARLLLVDPTIFPQHYYGATPYDASFILRRRNEWTSAGEMVERFRTRPPFATWDPQVLRDYCEFGLLPHNGAFVLACPPPAERSIYEHSKAPESNLYAHIPEIAQPVVILRAGTHMTPGVFDLNASPTAPDLASKFPHARDILLPGHNHYIPMECPERVAEEIRLLLQ